MRKNPETTLDTVCGMRVDAATAAAQVEYEGATYLFCSGHCADTFSFDPAKCASHPAHLNPFSMRSAKHGRTPAQPAGSVVSLPAGLPGNRAGLDREMTTATYTVDGKAAMTTSIVEVGGMLSALSARGVEKQLMQLTGIDKAEVNYVSGSATVTYDARVVSLREIQTKIQACGYHCSGELLPKHVCQAGTNQ